MSERIFTNSLLCLDGLNLQAQTRELTLSLGAESQDVTTIADLSRTRAGGLKDVALSSAGFFDSAEPDASLFAAVGVADSLITATAGVALGDVSYFFRAVLGSYSPFGEGSIGSPHGYQLDAAAYLGDLYRGLLMENGTILVTGNGTGRQAGAVSAAQSVRLALHVISVSGDWDVVAESDDNSGFTTATTRITESTITAVGGFYQALDGAITDDWWRLRFVENSAGSIEIVGSLSIQ